MMLLACWVQPITSFSHALALGIMLPNTLAQHYFLKIFIIHSFIHSFIVIHYLFIYLSIYLFIYFHSLFIYLFIYLFLYLALVKLSGYSNIQENLNIALACLQCV